MDSFDELEFLHSLSLKNMTRTGEGYNFSCPLCNEGKSPWKTRAYVLRPNWRKGIDHNTFVCFNCHVETTIKSLLYRVDHDVYRQYVKKEKQEKLDELRGGKIDFGHERKEINKTTEYDKDLKYVFTLSPRTFKPAVEVPEAVAYCKNRGIPDEEIAKLYYCFRENVIHSGMLIFPFYAADGKRVYGFQGRTIDGKKKFRTHSPNLSFKVWNIFQVNRDEDVYVFEAIIDAYCMENSISMLGADLTPRAKELINKRVFCFDNDRTGLVKSIKCLEEGERCFIWPNQLNAKDTNALITGKVATKEQISQVIKSHIYSGVEGIARAKLKLARLKR